MYLINQFISPVKACTIAFLCLGIFSCSDDSQSSKPESASEGLSLKKVVIALKANKNPEKMLAEKEAFETYLSTQLSRPVEVLIPTDSSVVVESSATVPLILGISVPPMLPATSIRTPLPSC